MGSLPAILCLVFPLSLLCKLRQFLRFEFEINFEFDIVIGISWFRRPPLLLFVIVILEQHVILKYPYFA